MQTEPSIWLTRAEIMALPMDGDGWQSVLQAAYVDPPLPNLADQDQDTNVIVLAKALVHVRIGGTGFRDEVRAICMDAIDTELGGRTLALGRELAAYVIAADLVGLEPTEDAAFRAWLRRAREEVLDGRTLTSTYEDRPNNWGTHAGCSLTAVALYLGETAEVDRIAAIFRGWLGDRASYSGFSWGDTSWQATPETPRGINAQSSMIQGQIVDGALPEEMRRGGAFAWPPGHTGYVWEALQGAVGTAWMLSRHGYPDVWEWEDGAIFRAVQFLYDLDQAFGGWWAAGDDEWVPWIVNRAYGSHFPTVSPASPGKNLGWTDWTHQPSGTSDVLEP